MQPVLISNATKMVLPGVGPVAMPLGQPVAQLKCSEAVSLPDKQVEAGVWECTPGVWSRQVTQAELCHFVAGHCFLRRRAASRWCKGRAMPFSSHPIPK